MTTAFIRHVASEMSQVAYGLNSRPLSPSKVEMLDVGNAIYWLEEKIKE